MDWQIFPRSLMLFGAILMLLSGSFHLLEKRQTTGSFLAGLYQNRWASYLIVAIFFVFSLAITILINKFWQA